ncbi:MAG: SAM-dependent methyltransferase [Celeribacter sp.]|jgi:SAM-dependent methyltransferase
MSVSPDHLTRLYADTDDPWNFRTSAYEQAKFAATRAALARGSYRHALELGCGNGALAGHLAPLCAAYTGVDAVPRALRAARQAVPEGRFIEGWLPDDLPDGDFDLIVLSEILYFLDPAGLARLGAQVASRWPQAELIAVTWLGNTGHDLQGTRALALFARALGAGRGLQPVAREDNYRIDRRVPGSAA